MFVLVLHVKQCKFPMLHIASIYRNLSICYLAVFACPGGNPVIIKSCAKNESCSQTEFCHLGTCCPSAINKKTGTYIKMHVVYSITKKKPKTHMYIIVIQFSFIHGYSL